MAYKKLANHKKGNNFLASSDETLAIKVQQKIWLPKSAKKCWRSRSFKSNVELIKPGK